LNLIDIKTSCTNHLDQWAAALHAKINQIRDELQMTLDHFDQKLQDKNAQLKEYLGNELELNVGCILKEQLQQFEIDKSKVDKANLEYNRLEKLFNSYNNQQLITMVIDSENQITLNPPTIICSDILMDGSNLTENVQDNMDWLDQQKTESFDNLTGQTKSCKCIHDCIFFEILIF
jgi:hypothetical protein